MTRWLALLLLLIGLGFGPFAQALPCLLHTSAAASPCPHEAASQAPQEVNRVADCFTQAAPLPAPQAALPELPPLITLPVETVWQPRPFLTSAAPTTSHHPPPRDTLAWLGHRRI